LDLLKNVFQYISDLGAAVTMPIIITVLGTLVGIGFRRSLRSGMMYGVGFTGILVILDLFLGSLGKAASAMVERFGFHLDVIDAGWTLGAAMAFSSPLMPVAFVAIIGINLLLIMAGFLKTLDVDLWNYWLFITGGVMIQQLTGSFLLGLVSVIVFAIIVIKLSDIWAKGAWDVVGLPQGVTLPHLDTISMAPVYFAVNAVLDRIPGVRDWNVSHESIQRRFGVFGEPVFIGGILGAIFGVLAGYDAKGVLDLTVKLAASMVLLPRVIGILMEGLVPIADGVRDTVMKRLSGRQVYIGLDAAVGVGHPSVMALGIVIVPIIMFLSVILPGNHVLPFADLSSMPFYMLWAVIACRGNLFRGIVAGTVGSAIYLWLGTFVAKLYTGAALALKLEVQQGASAISSISAGNPLYSLLIAIAKIFCG
jgi:PTS system galactitol-specific IIC component